MWKVLQYIVQNITYDAEINTKYRYPLLFWYGSTQYDHTIGITLPVLEQPNQTYA